MDQVNLHSGHARRHCRGHGREGAPSFLTTAHESARVSKQESEERIYGPAEKRPARPDAGRAPRGPEAESGACVPEPLSEDALCPSPGPGLGCGTRNRVSEREQRHQRDSEVGGARHWGAVTLSPGAGGRGQGAPSAARSPVAVPASARLTPHRPPGAARPPPAGSRPGKPRSQGCPRGDLPRRAHEARPAAPALPTGELLISLGPAHRRDFSRGRGASWGAGLPLPSCRAEAVFARMSRTSERASPPGACWLGGQRHADR